MPEQDRKNIDLIILTIGVLIGVAIGLFVIARDMGNESMQRMQLNDPDYQAAVTARIEPFGRVAIEGEVIEEPAAQVVESEEVPALMTGPQVYNAACLACHGAGVAGAPATGDAAAWGPRIAQGSTLLNQRAIEGFQGSAGFMPPKGGRIDLSDEEIIAAVDYMVEQSK